MVVLIHQVGNVSYTQAPPPQALIELSCTVCMTEALCVHVLTGTTLLLCSYLQAKGDYRPEDLNTAATTVLDIVLGCQQSSAAQVHLGNELLDVVHMPGSFITHGAIILSFLVHNASL